MQATCGVSSKLHIAVGVCCENTEGDGYIAMVTVDFQLVKHENILTVVPQSDETVDKIIQTSKAEETVHQGINRLEARPNRFSRQTLQLPYLFESVGEKAAHTVSRIHNYFELFQGSVASRAFFINLTDYHVLQLLLIHR